MRAVVVSAVLMLSAHALSAQITTYVAPPRPLSTPTQAVAATDSVRRDSATKAAMSNMKAWVDSAAGVSVPAHVVAIDSSAVLSHPARPALTTFSNGSVAPATASELPALAVLGAVVLAVGIGLLCTRPRG